MNLIEMLEEGSSSLARQINEAGYKAIIISGKSSFISDGLLRQAWSRNSHAQIPIVDLGEEGNKLLYKDFDNFDTIDEMANAFGKFLENREPDLARSKDSKYIYVDEHAYHGYKFNLARQTFSTIGMGNVGFGAIAAARKFIMSDIQFLIGIENEKLAELFRQYSNEIDELDPYIPKNLRASYATLRCYLEQFRKNANFLHAQAAE